MPAKVFHDGPVISSLRPVCPDARIKSGMGKMFRVFAANYYRTSVKGQVQGRLSHSGILFG